MAPRPTVAELVAGVRAGDRALLGRAITLVESTRAEDEADAEALLAALAPHAGGALRLGLTGVPGAGKSTLIDTLGTKLTADGRRVAVLAVDPSSVVSRGSILGDKTRMARLGVDANAFIRPSPSSGSLGGVARKTRETLLLCEAAGFDIVIVETVGVGQSEVMVADMVDVFVVLLVAGAGDELQGIKRGILELAEVVAINKADGDGVKRAEGARRELQRALQIMRGHDAPPVLAVSAITATGLDELWTLVADRHAAGRASGALAERRATQRLTWMWALVQDRLRRRLEEDPAVRAALPALERAVRDGTLEPTQAASTLLATFGGGHSPPSQPT